MRREPKAAGVLDFTPRSPRPTQRRGEVVCGGFAPPFPCAWAGVIRSKEGRGQTRASADSESMTKLRFIRLLLLAAMIAAAFAKGHPVGMSDGGYW